MYVQGCDGSVLLDKTPDGGSTEKDAMNNIGLEGFDLIDRIKGKLGESVSCADIVALAARDGTFLVHTIMDTARACVVSKCYWLQI